MGAIIQVNELGKRYEGGFEALKSVSLEVQQGEILALLGPNGAGKTTLISSICGISQPTSGSISVDGYDVVKDYRESRRLIGLVPQEIQLEPFETVWNTIRFSRGLFGKKPDPDYLTQLLEKLSLLDKKDNRSMMLSGGMKRRVLIAKALSHAPKILFLDEPTAGVDVDLRKDMWRIVEELKAQGTTIILTTHYIEEAEEIADRVAVINKGEIMLVEEKEALMRRMGSKQMRIELQKPLDMPPASLGDFNLSLSEGGQCLIYEYDGKAERTGITRLLAAVAEAGLTIRDIQTDQSSLEDIFVQLVQQGEAK